MYLRVFSNISHNYFASCSISEGKSHVKKLDEHIVYLAFTLFVSLIMNFILNTKLIILSF